MDPEIQQSQLETKLRQYQALLEVAESIAAHRDLSSLLQGLNERLQHVVKFDGINVVLADPKSNVMRMHLLESSTLSRERLFRELPIEEAASGWVWQTQQPMMITDLDAYQDRYPRVIAELRKYGIKTTYILPLTSAGRQLGALGFGSLKQDAWGEDDRELLEQVANLVAGAVDSAINFQRAREIETELAHKLNHLSLMLKITTPVVSQLDLRELLDVISSSICELMGADTAGVGLYDQ